MKYRLHIFLLLSGLFFGCKEKTLFERLDSDHTGIDFVNRFVENDTMNILNFEYAYNGGGVGIADFNNDGLQDIFFTGNQVPNRLYINKGNLNFEDITEKAGIESLGRWCGGVVTVDINADGLMDIYVAVTIKKTPEDRQNLLFVNQGVKDGIPVFKEMAKEYGVNDDGHSENAAFFDYDNDGDLDLYVLTNMIDQYPNVYRPKRKDGSHPNTDRLYRCDWNEELGHPVYTNVSKEAGITIEGYGLGINICDINRDGWKDIFITNDYISDDLFYINNGDGTFTDKAASYFKHTSNTAMGNDVADINNDGLLDIVALDMLPKDNLRKKLMVPPINYQAFNFSDQFGYTYQYMRNTLQLNNGTGLNTGEPMFSEIGLLAGIAETDWSWTPSLVDFDNDGYRDLLITNGFPKDVTDRDFMSFRANAQQVTDDKYLLTQIPEVKISNYAYRNKGDLTFEDVTKTWGLDVPSFSNGAAYADLDNDGDLDYVVNNINDPAFIYKNTLNDAGVDDKHNYLRVKFKGSEKNSFGFGAIAEIELSNGERMVHENTPHRGYLSSVEPLIHFGLGDKTVKSLKIYWQNGKMQVLNDIKPHQLLEVDIKHADLDAQGPDAGENVYFEDITQAAGINFVHREYDFIDFNSQNLLPFKLSQLGPGLSVGDVTGDGLEDIFIGGPGGKNGSFFIQSTNGTFEQKYLLAGLDSLKKRGEDLGSLLFDVDMDGDLDLYICRGGTEDRAGSPSFQDAIYLNDGKGGFTLAVDALPRSYLSNSCVRACDFDKDGDLDLLVAGRNVPFEYPRPTSSQLLRNDSKNGVVKFTDITSTHAPALNDIGLICDVLWTDYDNDGWVDVVLAGEWMPIQVLKNEKGKLNLVEKTGLETYKGLWNSVNGGDFDGDGDIDYIVGNLGRNTLLKATKIEPVKVLAKDFDNNGNYDIIPFVYFDGVDGKRKLVPFSGKDDVNKQLNPTRARFVSYKDFAGATYDNLVADEPRKGALELEINFTPSVYMENLGNGQFRLRELPVQAQFSPVNGTIVQDIDGDGNLDVLISGNNFGNEVFVGRYDASNGLFLKGDGKGGFTPARYSGFYAPGDAKALVSIVNSSGNLIVASAENRGKLRLFRSKVAGDAITLKPASTGVRYLLNGKELKKEVYYGSSYLSQSGRRIILPQGAKFIAEY